MNLGDDINTAYDILKDPPGDDEEVYQNVELDSNDNLPLELFNINASSKGYVFINIYYTSMIKLHFLNSVSLQLNYSCVCFSDQEITCF